VNQNIAVDTAWSELKNTAQLFDKTLRALENGGVAQGGDSALVKLSAISTAEGIDILNKTKLLWEPYLARVNMLMNDTSSNNTLYLLDTAVRFSLSNNLQLLDLMNQLTTTLEQGASHKANTLRTIQTVGIFLAMLNFMFILFKFLRRLRENDRAIEIAQNETLEIMATVKEGLFLLDDQFRIGSQYSASLEKMLGLPLKPGSDFKEIMRSLFTPEIYKNACDFIELLFSAHIKEGLLGDLNPLGRVEISRVNRQGLTERRYLSLSLNRFVVHGDSLHLLVTMFDISNEVSLEHALVDAKEEARTEVEGLLDLLKVEPVILNAFLIQTENSLQLINDELRGADGALEFRPLDYRRTVDGVFRKVHSFKCDAAVLGLDVFESLAQNFEASLSTLRSKATLSGEDLLGLPFHLEQILQRITTVKNLQLRLSSYHEKLTPVQEASKFSEHLQTLSKRIASDYGKHIELSSDLSLINCMPSNASNELKDIIIQLLRNAVTHGIEAAAERVKIGKPAIGNILITLTESTQGEYELIMRDDGRGLVPNDIRHTLLSSRRYTSAALDELSDKQILMKIFEPGFSTSAHVDRNGGHGVGLDVVHKKIEQLGARLRISTQQSAYTQFSIVFPS
jgi:two-component system, chemotaxis family, sensor kinase CheA